MKPQWRASALLVLGLTSITLGQTDNAPDAFRDLALRWMAAGFGSGVPIDRLDVRPGEIPDALRESLFIPENAKIVGSVLDRAEPRRVSITLDLETSRDETLEAYKKGILALGWRDPTELRAVGDTAQALDIFLVSNVLQGRVFCKGTGDEALQLNVIAGALQAGHTTLFLATEPGKCIDQRFDEQQSELLNGDLLPLTFPNDAKFVTGGGGGGGGPEIQNANQHVILETKQDIPDLARFYNDQFKKSGWTAQKSHADARLAWSSWSFKRAGRVWEAMLSVTGRTDARGRSLRSVSVHADGYQP
jgi:hypothetical protein